MEWSPYILCIYEYSENLYKKYSLLICLCYNRHSKGGENMENKSLDPLKSNISIADLIRQADFFEKKGNTLSFQTKSNNTITSLRIVQLPSGVQQESIKIDTDDRENLEKTIMELLKQGKSQKEVALCVGCSQATVSRIKKKKRT